MNAPVLWGFILAAITLPISDANPVPEPLPPTYHKYQPPGTRLGSDEVRITPLNRDVCLAKLLCGMSVVSIQDAHDSGSSKDGEIYGDYAAIVGKFFQENPPDEFEEADDDGSLSQETVEALEDYSVSNEDDDEEDHEVRVQQPARPQEPKKKIQRPKKKLNPTTSAPIIIKNLPTTKPTPPIVQIFDLGMPVQEGIKAGPRNPKMISLLKSPSVSSRMARARKILKQTGLETKLRTVRQCQRISGCNYTFKKLYQKYGGKGVIDEVSQPILPLPVVEEKSSRTPPPFDPKVKVPVDGPWDIQGPFDNPWQSPPEPTLAPSTSPLAASPSLEFGSMNAKIPPGLEPYFQPSLAGVDSPFLANPGTTYKVKKGDKGQQLPSRNPVFKKKKRKKVRTTTTEATTTTTTTTTTQAPTTTTVPSTTTSTTEPPRRLVHYKLPPRKKRPHQEDDDEDDDDDVNQTAPVVLIGNHEHDFDDEAYDHKQHHVEYEDDDRNSNSNESQDDYDEEAKYNTPVDYGNDEDSDEQDDEDDDDDEGIRPIKTKSKPKPLKVQKIKKPIPFRVPQDVQAQQQNDQEKHQDDAHKYDYGHQNLGQPYKHKPEKPFTKITNAFESVSAGRPKRLKKTGVQKDKEAENSSEETQDDEDVDDADEKRPPPFTYPTQIGGRPIFPDYDDVPATAYGITRSEFPRPQRHKPSEAEPSGWAPPKRQKSSLNSPQSSQQYYQYNPMTASSQHQQPNHHGGHPGYEPMMSSGLSVLSPITSLFKHLSSGMSPNPVGGSMGESQIHYSKPTDFGTGGQQGAPSSYPPGIMLPQEKEDESPIVPQIAIMPKIPVGPESSNYRRPEKYTVNKTKKVPSL